MNPILLRYSSPGSTNVMSHLRICFLNSSLYLILAPFRLSWRRTFARLSYSLIFVMCIELRILLRMTAAIHLSRGPGPMLQLSLSKNARTIAFKLASNFFSTSAHPGCESSAKYCKDLVRRLDKDAFLTSYFYSRNLQQTYFAVRAFNVGSSVHSPS